MTICSFKLKFVESLRVFFTLRNFQEINPYRDIYIPAAANSKHLGYTVLIFIATMHLLFLLKLKWPKLRAYSVIFTPPLYDWNTAMLEISVFTIQF